MECVPCSLCSIYYGGTWIVDEYSTAMASFLLYFESVLEEEECVCVLFAETSAEIYSYL